MMKANSNLRHIAKAITWRMVGTIDTIFLSWIVTGNPFTGLKIGGAELFTKTLLYYVHERLWYRFGFKNGQKMESKKRHLLKTISYRIFGTLDTMALAWIISGNPLHGVKIGFMEVTTKMILYYLHERVWYRIDFGLDRRRKTTLQEKEAVLSAQHPEVPSAIGEEK